MKKTSAIVLAVIVIGILGAIIIFVKKPAEKETENTVQKNLATFVQCLAEKNMTMYGAEWCSHCKREKALFGTAFKYVPYIECPENEKLCLDKSINGYPTWIDGIGKKYEGEQGLEGLAKISGCPLFLPETK